LHLVTLKDWTSEEVADVLDAALAVKRDPGDFAAALNGQTLALLFQKTSTRTRCSGEVGITQMGGHAIYLDWRATNFELADLGDEIRVLSGYADQVLVRFLQHADVVRAAEVSTAPVMNGCCDRYHPLQALADLMTIGELFGRVDGVRLTYVGVRNNVCNSLIAAALKTGLQVCVVAPESNPAALDTELYEAAAQRGLYRTEDDLATALRESDAVYTDTWIDMEYFTDPAFAAEKERRSKLFEPYRLSRQILKGLDLRIMHCLPAHRGYEIEGELLDDPRSVVFQQAENRLHTQKAVMLKLAEKLAPRS
jgi:ornithine carbamoyltransferase